MRAANMGIYEFEAKSIDGKPVKLDAYAGKLLLIVNVASKCGLTPQYEGLEALQRKYLDKGLIILGFPCDQFAHQEPGSEREIREFCALNYGVSFPLFSKIDVNGEGAHLLYQYLRREAPAPVTEADISSNRLYQHLASKAPELLKGDNIRWNFTKFLISRDGKVLKRFEPTTTPEDVEREIAPLVGG